MCLKTRINSRVAESIIRNTRAEAVTPTAWMVDMFECWETDNAETCNRMMMGVRSSNNSTIPTADVVEMFLSTTGWMHSL